MIVLKAIFKKMIIAKSCDSNELLGIITNIYVHIYKCDCAHMYIYRLMLLVRAGTISLLFSLLSLSLSFSVSPPSSVLSPSPLYSFPFPPSSSPSPSSSPWVKDPRDCLSLWKQSLISRKCAVCLCVHNASLSAWELQQMGEVCMDFTGNRITWAHNWSIWRKKMTVL